MFSCQLTKKYADFMLDLSFKMKNEVIVFLGPSGSGKTLMLNLISGITKPDSGSVLLNNKELFSSRTNLPLRKRNIGYIMQDYALFPHMTVRENIAFGLNRKDQNNERTDNLLELFNLTVKADKLPAHISGGQKQRAAIARALAAQPQMLLFDEPVSALDLHLRNRLLSELRNTAETFSLPILYVTHNFQEAIKIADRVAIINDGRIIESGSAKDIFIRPERLFTAEFIGIENRFPCTIVERGEDFSSVKLFHDFIFTVPTPKSDQTEKLWLCIKADDVRLIISQSSRPNEVNALITNMLLREHSFLTTLQVTQNGSPVDGFVLNLEIDELTGKKYGLVLNKEIRVSLKPERALICS